MKHGMKQISLADCNSRKKEVLETIMNAMNASTAHSVQDHQT